MKKILIAGMLLVGSTLFAQDINTESPSFSAGGMTVSKNIFQVETNFGVNLKLLNNTNNHDFILPTMLIRYGITKRLEVRVNPIMKLNKTNYQLVGTNVGAKYNIIGQKEQKVQMSIIGGYALPVVSLATKINFNTVLTFNYDFAEKHSLGVNLGYQYLDFRISNAKIKTNLFLATLIYNYQITNRLSCFVEGKVDLWRTKLVNIVPQINGGPSARYFWDTGLLYKFGDRYQIDYVFGMNFDNSYKFHMLGFHFMLNTSKKQKK